MVLLTGPGPGTTQALWLLAVMLLGTTRDKGGRMEVRTRGNSSPTPNPGMMCLLQTTPQPMAKGNGITE